MVFRNAYKKKKHEEEKTMDISINESDLVYNALIISLPYNLHPLMKFYHRKYMWTKKVNYFDVYPHSRTIQGYLFVLFLPVSRQLKIRS